MPPIRLAELHPIIVHFPIALLLTSLALDLAAVVFRRATLVEGATWALLLGAPGAVVALATGRLSEHDVNTATAPTRSICIRYALYWRPSSSERSSC